MFKSLREEVQEMEIAHEDPAKMLHQVTKRKYVLSTLFFYYIMVIRSIGDAQLKR